MHVDNVRSLLIVHASASGVHHHIAWVTPANSLVEKVALGCNAHSLNAHKQHFLPSPYLPNIRRETLATNIYRGHLKTPEVPCHYISMPFTTPHNFHQHLLMQSPSNIEHVENQRLSVMDRVHSPLPLKTHWHINHLLPHASHGQMSHSLQPGIT